MPAAALQVPEHLQCPDALTASFDNYDEQRRQFYNAARTWCVQAGILDPESMNGMEKKSNKHVKDISSFMNKLLGLNLEQQSIVFGCVSGSANACLQPLHWHGSRAHVFE